MYEGYSEIGCQLPGDEIQAFARNRAAQMAHRTNSMLTYRSNDMSIQVALSRLNPSLRLLLHRVGTSVYAGKNKILSKALKDKFCVVRGRRFKN